MEANTLSSTANAKTKVSRVLFITRKWGPAIGGMETYCERLTEELAKLAPVDVVALKGRANGSPPSAFSLLFFPFSVLWVLFSTRQRPSVVHLGDMAIWPLGLLALAFFPSAQLVLSAHGTDVAYGARGGLKGSLYSQYLRIGSRLLRRASVIANSRATKARLQKIGWNCSAVVPLATDLRSDATTDYNPKTLLFAGRLVTRKGLGWFVREVLPLLPRDVRLSVIGTRWDASEESALEHPQVDFHGGMPQADLARRFAEAACVIVPNIEPENGEYEGFGLIAPEAASAGGVVIASASGGLTDAVREGETGFLVEAGNRQAWAAKIAEVLDWEAATRRQFIASSQEVAQSHYAWERVAKETAAVYAR
ncbi:glycosyltransferase family 4 protein [Erythrobacter sp. SCSIO 43205]|uniref:glycosyltransferase family 4 protein n=1 Tax=Erythrobacter sp. SCSIO 43205 TaxID=2779361 RepID=UPI001CA98FF0|nr:glycosyltransferase family 4 protein [Erythrobacter sp. SCSIO 43205]UAB79454.1 glycosyltransferase family 4 protein [Erythrobacter sp. SCSIO 43205]